MSIIPFSPARFTGLYETKRQKKQILLGMYNNYDECMASVSKKVELGHKAFILRNSVLLKKFEPTKSA